MKVNFKVNFSKWDDCEPNYSVINGVILIISNSYFRLVISSETVTFVLNSQNEIRLRQHFGTIMSEDWADHLYNRLYTINAHSTEIDSLRAMDVTEELPECKVTFYSCYIKNKLRDSIVLLLFKYDNDGSLLIKKTNNDPRLKMFKNPNFKMFNRENKSYGLCKMEIEVLAKRTDLLYTNNLKLYKKSQFLRRYVDESVIDIINIPNNIELIKTSIRDMGLVNTFPDGYLCYDEFAISFEDLKMLNQKLNLIKITNSIVRKFKIELISKRLFDPVMYKAFREFVDVTREMGYISKNKAIISKFDKYLLDISVYAIPI